MLSDALKQRFDVLHEPIRQAGDEVFMMRARFPEALNVQIKPDESPVTDADKWANRFLRKHISSAFPSDAIVGEEDEDKTYDPSADFIWYIDPIDGTRGFIKGSDDFFVLAGLTFRGLPVMGLHYRPASQTLIYAWEGQPPAVMRAGAQADAPGPRQAWSTEAPVFIKIPAGNKDIRPEVTGYGVPRAGYVPGMVDMLAPLFGKAAGYISYRPTAYWDLVAPAAIMRAAGFRDACNSTETGTPLRFNDGQHQTDFFYSLPPDTPHGFIEHLLAIRRNQG